MTAREIDHRIAAIKRELCSLGPLRPGSITRQYNVCGSPSCRCKADPPKRHGPYYQLSYTHQRKSSSEFVREQDLEEVQRQLDNYGLLRTLVDEWVGLAIQAARLARAARTLSPRTPKPRKSAAKRLQGSSK
ncbi:MAG TPA: DUF6788 family protein [Candidatus Dormibacteraeota bacterium]|nr:DUF6788 family protein [Candidatus Dormibacteraeota bacterium]